MIKKWDERIVPAAPPCVEEEEIHMAMLAEIDELRAKLAALEVKLDAANRELDNVKQVEFPKKCEAVANGWRGKVERLEKKLAELESLYASPTCTSDEWRDAVLNTLADHGMDAPLTDTPMEIVKKLTDMVATMARDPAINAGAAPVPADFVEILKEASQILSDLTPETAPSSHRWPIADELAGFAAMLEAVIKEQT